MRAAQYGCKIIGKDTVVNISAEMGVTITIVLIFGCFEIWNCNKDRTAMKILRGSKDEELREKILRNEAKCSVKQCVSGWKN